MPMRTNGVYQDRTVPGSSNRGVGAGVAYPTANGRPGMGGDTQKPGYPKYAMKAPRGHEGMGNRTYKKSHNPY